MKDFEIESQEWWEVAKEYFTKELENNLAQHKANEKTLRYKLEVYLDFIYGSLTSTKVSGQDEEIEARPSGITQEEEVEIKDPQDLKSGIAQEAEV